MTVRIYITHSVKGIRADKAAYGYMMVCLNQMGEQMLAKGQTREGFGTLEHATQTAVILTAAAEAVERMKAPVELEIYTDSTHITNLINIRTPKKWKQDGYKNSKGEQVEDAGLWDRLLNAMEKHHIQMMFSLKHEFTVYLETELKAMLAGK